MRSIVEYEDRGQGGSNRWRGNCSPKLITDLVEQFHIEQLSDYMCGSNSTKAGCESAKQNIVYHGYDLHSGFDLMQMDIKERNEAIFWHPPYHDIIQYSGNMYSEEEVYRKYGYKASASDLSRCKDWSEFVDKMNYCMMKQFTSLEKGGYMFTLIGDIKKNGRLYSMLTDIVKPGKMVNIVIKKQFHCVSDRRVYNMNFIPIEHEYVLITQKDKAMVYQMQYAKTIETDIRDMVSATWKDILADVLSNHKSLDLQSIYQMMENRKKTLSNPHWREKIRQTLQGEVFQRVGKGVYALAK